MYMSHAALGFRVHSGWAALVVLGGAVETPEVIERRRVELADGGISGSVQPYHAAQRMKLPEAEAFLKRCSDATLTLAQTAVGDAVAELTGKGYGIAACCVLLASGRPTGDLAATLASHALIHTAEGEFFRGALKKACESCGLKVSGVKERELLSRGATALQMSTNQLQRRVSEMGKTIGPPWRQDEKLAALAAWLILA